MIICQVIRCNKVRTDKHCAMSTALAQYTPIIHCCNVSVFCISQLLLPLSIVFVQYFYNVTNWAVLKPFCSTIGRAKFGWFKSGVVHFGCRNKPFFKFYRFLGLLSKVQT